MQTVEDVAAFLREFAPPPLAEEWDNVGLLVGDGRRKAARVMTCLTVTPSTAAEAVREKASLIVTHHPLPFQPLKRITTDTPQGRLLWQLIGAKVSVYSPHTAFDSAAEGINQRLAEGLSLRDIEPLIPVESGDVGLQTLGSGRHGALSRPATLSALARRVKKFLDVPQIQIVGDAKRPVARLAVACGSAGSFLAAARGLGCDCLLTGETRFHTCLEAEADEMSLLLVGHFASERFGVEQLADVLAAQFAKATVWASRDERDPLAWV